MDNNDNGVNIDLIYNIIENIDKRLSKLESVVMTGNGKPSMLDVLNELKYTLINMKDDNEKKDKFNYDLRLIIIRALIGQAIVFVGSIISMIYFLI